ncbi:FAD-dependent oxidoreductase [Bosea sp. LjRoot9]
MKDVEVAVIGAGVVGISVAYYLVEKHGFKQVVLIDPRDPMSLTSAQSGENYRNWWPHPLMTAYTNHSISLMEEVARKSGDRINMTRRGYALATRRAAPDDLMADLVRGYGDAAEGSIRFHASRDGMGYVPPLSSSWRDAPDGVDVLTSQALIRETFPGFSPDIATVLHVRRAGSISGQQLGQFMLERIKLGGGSVIRGEVASIERSSSFSIRVSGPHGLDSVKAEYLVNAAGPFFADAARMMGEDLPIKNVYQQKIAFEDREGAIPRNLPFAIDLDGQEVDWSAEERELLGEDPKAARYLAKLPGGIHCRPDGTEAGKWIKLGWAFNEDAADPHGLEPVDPNFPDIVLRGASRLNPLLKQYIGRLPRGARHYGGYYTMTEENLPLIGPSRTPGAFMAGALSGFGTMAACATGAICAAWVAGASLPAYAPALSLARYEDPELMANLAAVSERSVL